MTKTASTVQTVAIVAGVLLITLAVASLRIFRPYFSPAHSRDTGWESVSALLDPLLRTAEAKREVLAEIIASPEYREQNPNRGILFIKTHKTGSSTVTSILHALATARNLTVPVPIQVHLHAQNDADFIQRTIPTNKEGVVGAPFDIWANHVIYGRVLEEVVPTAKGKVLTILRDPGSRLRSMCGWRLCCPYDKDDPLVWVRFIESDEGKSKLQQLGMSDKCVLDQSTRELVGTGLDASRNFDGNFRLLVRKIDGEEWLALVTERFPESMLVLLEEYELHPLDATYFVMKNRNTTGDGSERLRRAEEWVRTAAPHDTELHKVANRVLNRKLRRLFANAGEKKAAVARFRALNDAMQEACEFSRENQTDVGRWCQEKRLDDDKWPDLHRQW